MKNTMHSIMALILAALLLASMCACVTVAEGKEPEAAETSQSGSTGVIDTIMTAGTTQSFSSDPVPEEDVRAILLAGLAAESAMNQQPYFLVAITDKDVMTEISGFGGMFGAGNASSSGTMPDAPQGGDTFSSGTVPEGETPQGGDASSSGTMPDAPQGGDASSSGTMPDAPQGGTGSGDQKGSEPVSRGGSASLGDSPLAIIVYMNEKTSSGTASFDCGLAAQNMYIAAVSLGYGAKIVSSPTGSLNGGNHDQICEKLGVDPSMKAVAILLIGKPDTAVDGVSGATTRAGLDEKANIIG